MSDLFRALALITFGVSMTWLVSMVIGRLVARKGLAFWVWDRSGAVGRVLLAAGLALAAIGFGQGSGSATGSSLILLGSLLGMAGLWLMMPGP